MQVADRGEAFSGISFVKDALFRVYFQAIFYFASSVQIYQSTKASFPWPALLFWVGFYRIWRSRASPQHLDKSCIV